MAATIIKNKIHLFGGRTNYGYSDDHVIIRLRDLKKEKEILASGFIRNAIGCSIIPDIFSIVASFYMGK